MNRRSILRYIRIAVYIAIFIALVLLKIGGTSNFGECYIKENLGLLCPSCGITRGTEALLNFNFPLAIKYNSYFTLVLFPVFLILLVDDIICMISNKRSFVEIILRRIGGT